jgi:hypothetical protein
MNGANSLAECRLWQAVIVSTIQEWIYGPLRRKRQAEEYLFCDDSDFPAVCQSAGMDVGRLRAKLMRLRAQATATKAPAAQAAAPPATRPVVQAARRCAAQPPAKPCSPVFAGLRYRS